MSQFKQTLSSLKQEKQDQHNAEVALLEQSRILFDKMVQAISGLGGSMLSEFDDPVFQQMLLGSTSIDSNMKQLIAELRSDIETLPAKTIFNNKKYSVFFLETF